MSTTSITLSYWMLSVISFNNYPCFAHSIYYALSSWWKNVPSRCMVVGAFDSHAHDQRVWALNPWLMLTSIGCAIGVHPGGTNPSTELQTSFTMLTDFSVPCGFFESTTSRRRGVICFLFICAILSLQPDVVEGLCHPTILIRSNKNVVRQHKIFQYLRGYIAVSFIKY